MPDLNDPKKTASLTFSGYHFRGKEGDVVFALCDKLSSNHTAG